MIGQPGRPPFKLNPTKFLIKFTSESIAGLIYFNPSLCLGLTFHLSLAFTLGQRIIVFSFQQQHM